MFSFGHYIFVLDVSGSMQGEKIRTLKEGIIKVLEKLSNNDRFQIVTFENKAHCLTSKWIPATKENVNKWNQKIQNINASGGTNLLTA